MNADIEGVLRVDVLDETGPIEGLGADDYVAFTGDATDAALAWSDGAIRDVAGQEVRVRFHLNQGQIFSSWFE